MEALATAITFILGLAIGVTFSAEIKDLINKPKK